MSEKMSRIVIREKRGLPYPCPCCRFETLEARGKFEICPVCFWEDDGQDDPLADEVWGGPNDSLSLSAARTNYLCYGAVSEDLKRCVRKPTRKEQGYIDRDAVDGLLRFKRRFIYPFRWFYESHIWGFWIRLRYVRLFASAVWHWDSCDYAGTLRMMQIAFREISRLHTEHGHVVDSPRVARHTLIVSELCRRLEEDDYFRLAGYSRETWNGLPESVCQRIVNHKRYLEEQDAAYLGKMFRFVQHWWQ